MERIKMPEDGHSCVEAVCFAEAFCCRNFWDSMCVAQVAAECSLTCE